VLDDTLRPNSFRVYESVPFYYIIGVKVIKKLNPVLIQ